HVTDQKLWPALVVGLWTVGVGAGAGDHGRIKVDAGHLQTVLASHPDAQAAGSSSPRATPSPYWRASRMDRWPGPHPTSSPRASAGATLAMSAAMRLTS